MILIPLVTCSVASTPEQEQQKKSYLSVFFNAPCFSCASRRHSFSFSSPFLFHPQNSVAVASIHLPLAGTHISSNALQSVDNSTCKLQFIVFRNGKLFPCTGNSSNLADDGKRRSVSTPVAFTKLGKRKSMFLIMPVMSMLHRVVGSDCMFTGCQQLLGLRNMLAAELHILCFFTFLPK